MLAEQLEICRQLTNALLSERREVHDLTGRGIGLYEQQGHITLWKQTRPEMMLNKVNAQALQSVARQVDRSFQGFFRRVRNGEKPGYPRFKGEGRYAALVFPQVPRGCRFDAEGRLYVDKVGHIKIKPHRALGNNPRTASIRRTPTGKWFVFFACDEPSRTRPTLSGPVVGIDLGIDTFLATSDGNTIANPRFLDRDLKEMASTKRKLDRAPSGRRNDH